MRGGEGGPSTPRAPSPARPMDHSLARHSHPRVPRPQGDAVAIPERPHWTEFLCAACGLPLVGLLGLLRAWRGVPIPLGTVALLYSLLQLSPWLVHRRSVRIACFLAAAVAALAWAAVVRKALPGSQSWGESELRLVAQLVFVLATTPLVGAVVTTDDRNHPWRTLLHFVLGFYLGGSFFFYPGLLFFSALGMVLNPSRVPWANSVFNVLFAVVYPTVVAILCCRHLWPLKWAVFGMVTALVFMAYLAVGEELAGLLR